MMYCILLSLGLLSVHSIFCMQSRIAVQIAKQVAKRRPSRHVSNKSVLSCRYSTRIESKGPYAVCTSSSVGDVYISLYPEATRPKRIDMTSPSVESLDTIWDLDRFKTVHPPLKICEIARPDQFGVATDTRVLDMPIKMGGTNDYRLPIELVQFVSVLQQMINCEHALLDDELVKKYYAYLTIDQGWVKKGSSQRKRGAHVDGFQGARINPKTFISHNYLAMNFAPTIVYHQPFNFDGLDEKRHNFFTAMDNQKEDDETAVLDPNAIYLVSAYTVHEAGVTKEAAYRTFLRLTYDVKKFVRIGNTHNPSFDYNWRMVERDIPSHLQ